MTAFTALNVRSPDAGKFPLAEWLERIVNDRRDAIVAHAEHLMLTFERMEMTLKRIASDFDDMDGDNAKQVGAAIKDMQSKIGAEISTFDQNTEKERPEDDKKKDGDKSEGDKKDGDKDKQKELKDSGDDKKHGGTGGPK